MLLGDHSQARKACKLAEEKLRDREQLFVLRGQIPPNHGFAEIDLTGSDFPDGVVEVDLVSLKFCVEAFTYGRRDHYHFKEPKRTATTKYPRVPPRQRYKIVKFPLPVPAVRRLRPIIFEAQENLQFPGENVDDGGGGGGGEDAGGGDDWADWDMGEMGRFVPDSGHEAGGSGTVARTNPFFLQRMRRHPVENINPLQMSESSSSSSSSDESEDDNQSTTSSSSNSSSNSSRDKASSLRKLETKTFKKLYHVLKNVDKRKRKIKDRTSKRMKRSDESSVAPDEPVALKPFEIYATVNFTSNTCLTEKHFFSFHDMTPVRFAQEIDNCFAVLNNEYYMELMQSRPTCIFGTEQGPRANRIIIEIPPLSKVAFGNPGLLEMLGLPFDYRKKQKKEGSDTEIVIYVLENNHAFDVRTVISKKNFRGSERLPTMIASAVSNLKSLANSTSNPEESKLYMQTVAKIKRLSVEDKLIVGLNPIAFLSSVKFNFEYEDLWPSAIIGSERRTQAILSKVIEKLAYLNRIKENKLTLSIPKDGALVMSNEINPKGVQLELFFGLGTQIAKQLGISVELHSQRDSGSLPRFVLIYGGAKSTIIDNLKFESDALFPSTLSGYRINVLKTKIDTIMDECVTTNHPRHTRNLDQEEISVAAGGGGGGASSVPAETSTRTTIPQLAPPARPKKKPSAEETTTWSEETPEEMEARIRAEDALLQEQLKKAQQRRIMGSPSSSSRPSILDIAPENVELDIEIRRRTEDRFRKANQPAVITPAPAPPAEEEEAKVREQPNPSEILKETEQKAQDTILQSPPPRPPPPRPPPPKAQPPVADVIEERPEIVLPRPATPPAREAAAAEQIEVEEEEARQSPNPAVAAKGALEDDEAPETEKPKILEEPNLEELEENIQQRQRDRWEKANRPGPNVNIVIEDRPIGEEQEQRPPIVEPPQEEIDIEAGIRERERERWAEANRPKPAVNIPVDPEKPQLEVIVEEEEQQQQIDPQAVPVPAKSPERQFPEEEEEEVLVLSPNAKAAAERAAAAARGAIPKRPKSPIDPKPPIQGEDLIYAAIAKDAAARAAAAAAAAAAQVPVPKRPADLENTDDDDDDDDEDPIENPYDKKRRARLPNVIDRWMRDLELPPIVNRWVDNMEPGAAAAEDEDLARPPFPDLEEQVPPPPRGRGVGGAGMGADGNDDDEDQNMDPVEPEENEAAPAEEQDYYDAFQNLFNEPEDDGDDDDDQEMDPAELARRMDGDRNFQTQDIAVPMLGPLPAQSYYHFRQEPRPICGQRTDRTTLPSRCMILLKEGDRSDFIFERGPVCFLSYGKIIRGRFISHKSRTGIVKNCHRGLQKLRLEIVDKNFETFVNRNIRPIFFSAVLECGKLC